MSLRPWVIAIPAALSLPAFSQITQDLQVATVTWHVSGRVIMDDGRPPSEAVTIESVCNGVAYAAATTDGSGRFSLRIGAFGATLLQDASVPRSPSTMANQLGPLTGAALGAGSNVADGQDAAQQSGVTEPRQPVARVYRPGAATERAMDSCELHATLGGYWAEPISLRNRRPLDTAPVGTIVLHRIGSAEGRTVSVTTLAVPKNARNAYEKGRRALERERLDEARVQFEKAVRLYPEFAMAWGQLGQIQVGQKRPDDALRSYENAIRADPNYVQPYLGLAAVQMSQKQWEKLISTTSQAIKLDPVHFPQAYYMNAVGNYYAHRLEAAEKSAREAQRLDGPHRWPKISRVLGLILATRGEFAGAAAQFREYLRIAPRASDADEVRQFLARAEELGAVASEP